MSINRNIETKQAVSSVIKELKVRCVEACNAIENCNINAGQNTGIVPNSAGEPITLENINEKALCYVRGLHMEIENCNTSITTDDNLLTSQFLNEMEAKTSQIKELNAYTNGLIADMDSEINRLNVQIQTAEEALSRPRTRKQEVQPEHVNRAKEFFHSSKTHLHGVIESLFPDKADAMKEILGSLMSENLNGSPGYLEITPDNMCLIELLRGTNIVTVNPYNNMEVKLAF